MALTLPDFPEPGADEVGPYCIIATHRALPGKADAFERRMLEDIPFTRSEPGCLAFHIHRDRAEPDIFVVYEVWQDRRALLVHLDTDYAQRFIREATDYETDDMRVQFPTMASPYAAGREPKETLG